MAAFLTVIDPATAPTVEGAVVETGTGTPLAATVTVGPYVTTTDPGTGAYSIQVPEGTYDLTATATDHAPQTVAGVTLVAHQTFVQDFSLVVFSNLFRRQRRSGERRLDCPGAVGDYHHAVAQPHPFVDRQPGRELISTTSTRR